MVRLHFHQRREEIKKLIEHVGLWNLDKTQLANKYSVSRQMIYEDLKAIIKTTPPEEIQEIRFELRSAFKKAINESRRILATTHDDELRLKAIKTIGDITAEFTKFLESYGLKDKIAEVIEFGYKWDSPKKEEKPIGTWLKKRKDFKDEKT